MKERLENSSEFIALGYLTKTREALVDRLLAVPGSPHIRRLIALVDANIEYMEDALMTKGMHSNVMTEWKGN